MSQRMNSGEWCLRSRVRSYPVLLLFSMQYITGKFRKCQKPPEDSMIVPRSHTGNIFQSWTVVVRRHHVYVREFHLPSCNSVRFWGEGYTHWRSRGWESPSSDEVTYTVVLFIHIYVLCGLSNLGSVFGLSKRNMLSPTSISW